MYGGWGLESGSQPAAINTHNLTIISSELTESQPLFAPTSSLKTISSSPLKNTKAVTIVTSPFRPRGNSFVHLKGTSSQHDFYKYLTMDTTEAKNVYVLKWDVTNDFMMDKPWVCQSFNDHLACMNSELRLRFEYEMEQREKLGKKLKRKEEELQRKQEEVASLKSRLDKVEGDSVKVVRSSWKCKMRRASTLMKKIAKLDDLLAALDVEFDIELFLNMLKVMAAKRWVIDHAIEEGQRRSLEDGVVHSQAGRDLEDIEAYYADAKDK
ncbi:hypothetical protein Tco_0214332 [Tanacetum coccineum]